MITPNGQPSPRVAIACGGTGGHLFPGMAVAEELEKRACEITLITSEKEVDRLGSRGAGMARVLELPAIGLKRGGQIAFVRALLASFRAANRYFAEWRPHAVLAMGGFTSAPPVLAGKLRGTAVFLHESNAVPGRANRWLSWLAGHVFLGFSSAREGLHAAEVLVTGTPVRSRFRPQQASEARRALGLGPEQPVLLIMGGSQGAGPLNQLMIAALPVLQQTCPELQFIHLTGAADTEAVQRAFVGCRCHSLVRSFFEKMELAMGAATIAVSRAGASSLAELAAMRLPAVLVPYPAATDNHQLRNALAFSESGAAVLVEQHSASVEGIARRLCEIVRNPTVRQRMQQALESWHTPGAASQMAHSILRTISAKGSVSTSGESAPPLPRNPPVIA